jgi:hypothetical protein
MSFLYFPAFLFLFVLVLGAVAKILIKRGYGPQLEAIADWIDANKLRFAAPAALGMLSAARAVSSIPGLGSKSSRQQTAMLIEQMQRMKAEDDAKRGRKHV